MNFRTLLTLSLLPALQECGPPTEPAPVWQSMDGPAAREVTALYADPASRGTIHAALATGEIIRSDDNGSHWARQAMLPQGATVHRFVPSADTLHLLYAATSSGPFRSSGSGAWMALRIDPLPAGTGVRALATGLWDPSVVYAGTEMHGIVKSTDNGKTWRRMNEGVGGLSGTTVVDLTVDKERPDVVLAAADGFGILRSTDGGASWRRHTPEFTATGSQVVRVFLGRRGGNDICYGTSSGLIGISHDAGLTWSHARIAVEGAAIEDIDQSAGNPRELLAGTERGLLFSDDFGEHWNDMSGSLPHVRMCGAFCPGSPGCAMAFGSAAGLQRTEDQGATWMPMGRGAGGSTVTVLATDEQGQHLYAGLAGEIVTYDPGTSSWSAGGAGLAGDSILALSAGSSEPLTAVAATPAGGFRTTDGGSTWTPVMRMVPAAPRTVEVHPRVAARIYAGGSRGVYLSTDRGETWVHGKPATAECNVRSFTFQPDNAGIVYAATSNAAVIGSRDAGFTWEPARFGITTQDVGAVTLSGNDPLTAYAWTSAGEGFRTADGGMQWNRIPTPWHGGDTAAFAVDRFVPSSAVVRVNGRFFYRTRNGGGTWTPLTTPQPPGEVTALLWNAAKGTLYAGIRHRGVFRAVLTAGP